MTEIKKSENGKTIQVDLTKDSIEKIEIDTDAFFIDLIMENKENVQIKFTETSFFSLINFFKE